MAKAEVEVEPWVEAEVGQAEVETDATRGRAPEVLVARRLHHLRGQRM